VVDVSGLTLDVVLLSNRAGIVFAFEVSACGVFIVLSST
jgi:hypothetical protein